MVGKVERVALRNVWKNEARDFTVWLADNLELLSDLIGGPIELIETEKSVGTFNVDILAEDMNGNAVVIENQLEKTDHDHLGKVLTYTTNLEAKTAIWITSNPRKEHAEAISWLNEYTPVNFFLIKVEAITIDDSKPAPLFSVICEPNEDTKKIGEKKAELSQANYKRMAFWERLLERSQGKTSLFSNVKPVASSWISTGIGLSGLSLNYTITNNVGGVELYIDKGNDGKETNKARFDYLYERKDEIESNLKVSFEWYRLDDKRASRIKKVFSTGLYDEEKQERLQDEMIEFMIAFEKELKQHISVMRKL